MQCWLRRVVCKAQNLRVASSVLLCLSLNFIRMIDKKIIVTSLVLVYFFSLHAFTSLPSIFNNYSTLPRGDAACPWCAALIYRVNM